MAEVTIVINKKNGAKTFIMKMGRIPRIGEFLKIYDTITEKEMSVIVSQIETSYIITPDGNAYPGTVSGEYITLRCHLA